MGVGARLEEEIPVALSHEESAHVFANYNDGTLVGDQYRCFYAIAYVFSLRAGTEFRKLQVWMFKFVYDRKQLRWCILFDMHGVFKNCDFHNQKPRPGQYEGLHIIT